jgi:hypothetical protein
MSAITHEKLKVTSPIDGLTVTGLSLKQGPGEHGTLLLRGVTETGDLPDSAVKAAQGQKLCVAAPDGEGRPVFNGIVTSVQADRRGSLCSAVIEASTASAELDTVLKSRSFQDVNMTYEDVVDIVLGDTPGAYALFSAGSGVPIGRPLIQYMETDWAFVKRLASHFNAPVIPDATTGEPNLWFGVPQRPDAFAFMGTEYTAGIDKSYFALGGSESGHTKSDFVYYVLRDENNRRIGDAVRVSGREYTICAKSAEFVKGEIVFRYKVCSPICASVPMRYNDKITGLSLTGTVTKTANETVELALDIDGDAPHGSCPYTWAPATGNLVYCMPRVGTKASLYFPGRDERAAFANVSVRENGSVCEGMSDTQRRGFVSEHGKHLDLFPGNVALSNGGGMSVNLADASEIGVTSDKQLRLIAKGRIVFAAKSIYVRAPYSLKFYQNKDAAGIANAMSGGFAGGGIVHASRSGATNAKGNVHAVERTGGQEEAPRPNPILSKGDAAEFGKDSDTYKILSDLEKRWDDACELPKAERDALQGGYEKLAEDAKRLALDGTPYMYGQEVVMNTLHENAKTAKEYQSRLYDSEKPAQYTNMESYFSASVSYLVGKAYGDWNYKEQNDWKVGRVKYDYFNGNKMDENNNRNWNEWIYFDGEIWGADQIGNMNMAYVGMKMELPKAVFNNPLTRQQIPRVWERDERDIKAIEKGIEVAESGR